MEPCRGIGHGSTCLVTSAVDEGEEDAFVGEGGGVDLPGIGLTGELLAVGDPIVVGVAVGAIGPGGSTRVEPDFDFPEVAGRRRRCRGC